MAESTYEPTRETKTVTHNPTQDTRCGPSWRPVARRCSCSSSLTERLGLGLIWRTDSENLDPDAIRLFCTDRPIRDEVQARVTAY